MARGEAAVRRQLSRLLRQEQKLLHSAPGFAARRCGEAAAALEGKLPDRVRKTLCAAFEKGFLLVLEHGAGIIDRGCAPEKRRQAYAKNRDRLEHRATGRAFARFDHKAKNGVGAALTFSAIEGTALGFLGIGLPDIPVLAATLLKTVYSVGLDYGFSHGCEEERIFALQILCAAASGGEERIACSARADRVGAEIDSGVPCEATLAESMSEAAQKLCARLLAVKAVQGVPLAGAAGGLFNGDMVNRAGKMAYLKYKKRFLRTIF